jgi:GntR family transcriptional regulator
VLNQGSAIPLYCQLQEIIRSRIESGELKPGEQLPPLPELCRDFGLSQGTVRQALSDLERQGLIVRRHGKGSYVAHPHPTGPQDLSAVSSFSTYYRTVLGSELGSRLISVDIVPSNRSVAKKLEIPEQTEVVAIQKLKMDEGQPYFLVTSYVARSMFPGIECEDHTEGSLIDLLHGRYQVHITRVRGWLEPVLTGDFESKMLNVRKRSTAMLYDRLRYSGSRPVVLSRHIIRGDKCRLTFQLEESE